MNEKTRVGSDLQERLSTSMREDLGVSEKMADQLADSVMRCFAGEQLYFPARQRVYPMEELQKALESGATAARVARKFELSRSKLHSLFPGGLPRKIKS